MCGEVKCVDWLENEESLNASNQKMDDLWHIPLELERGDLSLAAGRNYRRKYRRKFSMVEDWNESPEIWHLLKDVLPNHWKTRLRTEQRGVPRRQCLSRSCTGCNIMSICKNVSDQT